MHCSQLSAILHMFGVKFGYYDPKNFKEACYIDPVVETYGDVINTVGGYFFAQDEEAKTAAAEKIKGVCAKFLGLVEKNLNHHNGPWLAGNKVTIGDFVMASYFGNFVNNPACPVKAQAVADAASCPKTMAYCARVMKEFTYLTTRPPIGPF